MALNVKRVLLKLSGAALSGNEKLGIDPDVARELASEIGALAKKGVQVAVVIGGGNLFRGKTLSEAGLDRITGDYMGMLGTVVNALAMRDVLERQGFSTRVMSAIPVSGVVEQYDREKAINFLNRNRIVIFAGGSGNPLVTTDYTASLRAIEVGADILLKATDVDGVYSKDPKKSENAEKYEHITYKDVLSKELAVMDLSAFCMCRDHNLPIIVFNIKKSDTLEKVVNGEKIGTLVSSGEEK